MDWILAHFIGDYLLQNDWMAKNKKSSRKAALVHVSCYLIPFLFTPLSLWQLALIGVQHYWQDRSNFVSWYCNIMGKKEFLGPPFSPSSYILMDNLFHIIFIAFVVALPHWLS
jgi:hypothetical protein